MFSDQTTHLLAIGVLAVLAAALLVWALRGYGRMRFTPAQFPIYMYNYFMTRVLWRARLAGAVSLPPHQGAVIVCNHRSPIDPGFVALACDRPVHWMVAREYVHHPLVGWGLRILQVIPVGRAGIDTAATKLAMRYAQRGDLVGMFPEGRINTTDQFMLPGRPGAAMVALKARVPVVPCYIDGSPWDGTDFGFLLMTAKTHLRVGKPIDLSEYYGQETDREILKSLTRRFMREIAALAGLSDYEPKLAGKEWKEAV